MSGIARNWVICGTPNAVRQYAPDFDGPINNGPFLVVLLGNNGVVVFEREALLSMLGSFVNTLDHIMRTIEMIDGGDT